MYIDKKTQNEADREIKDISEAGIDKKSMNKTTYWKLSVSLNDKERL